MINVNISPDGGISISQEPLQERAHMQGVYSSMASEINGEGEYSGHDISDQEWAEEFGVKSDETGNDDEHADYFKKGWDAALEEVKMRFVKGQLLDFFVEVGTPTYSDVGVSQVDMERAAREHESFYGEQKAERSEIDEFDATTWPEEPKYFDGTNIQDGQEFSYSWIGEAQNSDSKTNEDGPMNVGPLTRRALREARLMKGDPVNHVPNPSIRPVVDSGEPAKEVVGGHAEVDMGETGTWTISSDELDSRLDAEYQRGVQSSRRITRPALHQMAFEIIALDTMQAFVSGEAIPTPFHKAFGDSVENFVVPLAQKLGFKVVG